MSDIICPLFDVPDPRPLLHQLQAEGITIRHARAWEQTTLAEFILPRFGQGWVDEISVAYRRHPASVLIALDGEKIIGFAGYEVSAPSYFGPTGVDATYRGRRIGKALFLAALHELRALGYVYGIIGSPGPVGFYLNATPSLELPETWHTIYSTLGWGHCGEPSGTKVGETC